MYIQYINCRYISTYVQYLNSFIYMYICICRWYVATISIINNLQFDAASCGCVPAPWIPQNLSQVERQQCPHASFGLAQLPTTTFLFGMVAKNSPAVCHHHEMATLCRTPFPEHLVANPLSVSMIAFVKWLAPHSAPGFFFYAKTSYIHIYI